MPTQLTHQKIGEIKWADVKFLSLCIGGRTGFKGLYKAEGKAGVPKLMLNALTKAFGNEEKGQLATVIYPVNMPDVDGEWASADVLEKICHKANQNGFELDIHHDGEPVGKDKAFIAENWILQGEDPRFEGIEGPKGLMKSKDLIGSWVGVIQIDDPDLRKVYREEGWSGVSIGGDYGVLPNSAPPVLEKAMTIDEMKRMFSGAIKGVLRRDKDNPFSGETVRYLSLDVTVPRPGERDYDGVLRRPSLSFRISSDME